MAEQPPPELDSRPQSRREWTGHLSSLVLPLALVVVVIGGLLYLQSGGGDVSGDGDFGTVTLPADRNPTGRPPDASEGRAAPDFLLPGTEGEAVRLSDLQGGPVVVSFWASWCSRCRSDLVSLASAVENHDGGAFRVLALNLRESDERAGAFTKEFGLPFTTLLDRSGQVASTWRTDGPDGSVPATYFIDAGGIVRLVVQGSLSDDALEHGLSLILEGEE